MSQLNAMVITTSRADYGLLYPLIQEMLEDGHFHVQLAATGSHLSVLHGETIHAIEKNGIRVAHKVHNGLQGDTEHDLCRAISQGLSGFSTLFTENKPDFIVVLGDRYELWAVCVAAVIHKVPIVHIHGGELTHGLIDDPVRHSVTKMASIHFPSIELYRKRIIQMGEKPETVHAVGALGIDNIKNIVLMDTVQLSEYTGVDFINGNVALMTYHPVTLEEYHLASAQVCEIFDALLETDLLTVITMPNCDTGSQGIYHMINRYAQKYSQFKMVKNLGQQAYLSAMKYARLMIGNSSSGIIESASFGLPVINIGDRQAGRFKPSNIIDCACDQKAIVPALEKAQSKDFLDSISRIQNPYGDGKTAGRIVNILKSIAKSDYKKLIKKGFYDLGFDL